MMSGDLYKYGFAGVNNMRLDELFITEDDVMPYAMELKLLMSKSKQDHDRDYLQLLDDLRKKYGEEFSKMVWQTAKKLMGE